jgi:hypothetical protein
MTRGAACLLRLRRSQRTDLLEDPAADNALERGHCQPGGALPDAVATIVLSMADSAIVAISAARIGPRRRAPAGAAHAAREVIEGAAQIITPPA